VGIGGFILRFILPVYLVWKICDETKKAGVKPAFFVLSESPFNQVENACADASQRQQNEDDSGADH
jgi:hypothetical protein